jgi:soluble lytic murein transglycosylase-like protein
MDTLQDNPPRHRATRLHNIAFVGSKIWVSELTSIVLVCALLAALLPVTLVILRNEFTMSALDYDIAAAKAQKINMAHELAVMREKQRLVRLLDEVAEHKISSETIYRISDLIYQNSRQFGYSPELLLAVMSVESRFDPKAMGRYRGGGLSGAIGIMQIKYETAAETAKTLGMEKITRQDLLDPEINMILGTAYLMTLITRFNSFKLGILAYNLGPGTVRGSLARNEALPMRYYEKVLKQYYRLKEMEKNM